MAPFFLFITLLQIPIAVSIAGNAESPMHMEFRAILVFGDSTVDTGNNNYIQTIFKANYHPYGKDFPGHVATGRFSNGKLVPDFISSYLGIKDYVPPFLDPNLSKDELRTGVCFASAGSGYDDMTSLTSRAIPFSKQIEYFKTYINNLKEIVGEVETNNIIGRALVVCNAGTNDFALNYYNIPTRRLNFTIDEYQNFLIQRIENFVKKLYALGCRSMLIGGLPPIGCLPIEMTVKRSRDGQCLEDQNKDARAYNQKLQTLLARIQGELPGSKIIFSDVYKPLTDMITHPDNYGFVEAKRGCCGTGPLELGPLCNPSTPVCSNSSQYLFWDSIHPSESTYRYLSEFLEAEILPQFKQKGSD